MMGVTTDNREIELSQSTMDALKARLRGPLLLPGDSGYDDSRTVWNAMIDRRPGARRALPGYRRRGRVRAIRARARAPALHQGRRPQHRRTGYSRRRPDAGPLADARRVGRAPGTDRSRAGGLPPGRRGSRDSAPWARRSPGVRVRRPASPGLTLGGGFGYLTRRYGWTCDTCSA